MNLKELDNFSLSDAIKFHDQLNPALFNDERMKPEVRHKLLEISEEFVDSLGINQLHIKDIVVSGSNAAYSYTDHSDIDLHIITDMNEFNNNNIYLELFTAKKNLFNDDHNIKIKGYDVEVYVQDSNKPVRTLGEYSVLNNKWTKLPSKRRANFDQSSVELKFTKLIQLSELALRDTNIDKLQNLLATLRKYRQAGLDEHGEFGPENLAYKALRTHGYVDKLYDHLNDLISKKLSLDEMIAEQREQLVWLKGKLSGSYTDKQLKDMGARLHNGQWVIPKARFDTLVRLGQLRESTSRLSVAEASPFPKSNDYIADELDKLQQYCEQNNRLNLAEYVKAYSMSFRESMKLGVQMFFWMRTENYYMYKSINKNLKTVGDKIDLTRLVKRELVRKNSRITETSGYIPSEAEKNDPRFKTALTVDIHPNTMKQNAKKLGSKISRAGIPPILKPSGKI